MHTTLDMATRWPFLQPQTAETLAGLAVLYLMDAAQIPDLTSPNYEPKDLDLWIPSISKKWAPLVVSDETMESYWDGVETCLTTHDPDKAELINGARALAWNVLELHTPRYNREGEPATDYFCSAHLAAQESQQPYKTEFALFGIRALSRFPVTFRTQIRELLGFVDTTALADPSLDPEYIVVYENARAIFDARSGHVC